jgi:hypothetical protein
MNEKPLVVITTRLPPAMCGIGTCSWLMREHWPNESVRFLVLDEAPSNATTSRGDSVTSINGGADALTRELDRIGAADIVLHYAGRAYHRFGFPFWLPRALSRWKRRYPESRLAVFVHEVPGALPMTSRHYWLGRLSKAVLRRLAVVADELITNTEHHARELKTIAKGRAVSIVPIASNIEAAAPEQESRSRGEFVLFGLPFGRLQTLQIFDRHIDGWLSAGVLKQLHIIGPHDDRFAAQAEALLSRWPRQDFIIRHGVLSSPEVAHILHRAQFALTNATEETWSKSGAFMACAANACPVVIAEPAAGGPLSYAIPASEVASIKPVDAEARAAKLKAWSDENADWPVIAARVISLVHDTKVAA